MRYMLTFFQPTSEYQRRVDPKQAEAYMGAWMAYAQEMYASGLVLAGDGLLPPETGASIRIRNGKQQVQDGPYPDTKEHLGGFFIIEAPSMKVALEWAAKSPSTFSGTTEVREVMERTGAK
jgi:hypothetical protein